MPRGPGPRLLTAYFPDPCLILKKKRGEKKTAAKTLNTPLMEMTATVLQLSGFKLKFPVGLQSAYGANKSPVALNKC